MDRVRFEVVSKPGGGTRRLAHLRPEDAATYRSLVRPMTPRIESVLSGGVMANRGGGGGGGAPPPPAPARREWRRRVASMLDGGVSMVVSDVESFYPSVGERALSRALRMAGVPLTSVSALSAFLRGLWEAGVEGLPVGPEPSAILANCVLAGADEAVLERGVALARWVDDVVLVASDRHGAERAYRSWTAALAEAGLRPNEAKTRLMRCRDEALEVVLAGSCSSTRPRTHMIRPQ